mgnify:CR=1 FL=1
MSKENEILVLRKEIKQLKQELDREKWKNKEALLLNNKLWKQNQKLEERVKFYECN